jgi:hypothetical protein
VAKGHILDMSKRPIATGEELTVDYQFVAEDPDFSCRCGAAGCRGTINVGAETWERLRRKHRSRSGGES